MALVIDGFARIPLKERRKGNCVEVFNFMNVCPLSHLTLSKPCSIKINRNQKGQKQSTFSDFFEARHAVVNRSVKKIPNSTLFPDGVPNTAKRKQTKDDDTSTVLFTEETKKFQIVLLVHVPLCLMCSSVSAWKKILFLLKFPSDFNSGLMSSNSNSTLP